MHKVSKILTGTSLAVALATAGTAQAGTFANITMDGFFGDWAGIPVLVTDAADNAGQIDFASIQLANDDDFLYVRIVFQTARSNGAWFAVDTDENPATGFDPFGISGQGEEAGWVNDFAVDQRTGFNVGGLAPITVVAADGLADNCCGDSIEREIAIPRNVAYINNPGPVFVDNDFTFIGWTDTGGGDVTTPTYYQFAVPEPASMALIGLGGLAMLRRR
jgi:PEP-CTERM motif-containing protein